MDEFDKIREISADLTQRKEPTFTNFTEPEKRQEEPVSAETAVQETESDDASQYEFPADFRSRLDSLQPAPVEEKNFPSMKLHFIAIGLFTGILVVVLAGFFIFSDSDEITEEVITISATPEAVKVKPEQPGGINIPDQDKMIYDRIRSEQTSAKVESLFPEPEKPVVPEILAVEQPEEPVAAASEVAPVIAPAVPAVQPQPTTEEEAMARVKAMSATIEPKEPVLIEAKLEETPPAPKKEIVPLAKAEPAKVAEKAVAVSKPAVKASGKEIWHAQLMSSNNKASVEKAWPKILAKNKALLSNMSYEIKAAEIPGKGTFYRLRVGQFKTRDMAATLCKKLKARKQDCVPAK